jgi:hypothetical protein
MCIIVCGVIVTLLLLLLLLLICCCSLLLCCCVVYVVALRWWVVGCYVVVTLRLLLLRLRCWFDLRCWFVCLRWLFCCVVVTVYVYVYVVAFTLRCCCYVLLLLLLLLVLCVIVIVLLLLCYCCVCVWYYCVCGVLLIHTRSTGLVLLRPRHRRALIASPLRVHAMRLSGWHAHVFVYVHRKDRNHRKHTPICNAAHARGYRRMYACALLLAPAMLACSYVLSRGRCRVTGTAARRRL